MYFIDSKYSTIVGAYSTKNVISGAFESAFELYWIPMVLTAVMVIVMVIMRW